MMTPLSEYQASRIALTKPSALGDIVHSLPVLRALRQRFPAAHITWIVNRSYESLLTGHPDLDEVLAFDRAAVRRSRLRGSWAFLRFLWEIRRRHFDLVIDLQGLLRSGIMSWASRAPRRIGLRSAREGANWFYTDILEDDLHRMHAVDRYWMVAEALGVGHAAKRFHLPVNPSEREWAEEKLRRFPRPRIMMNVGTRWETKRWPAGHFAALAERAVHAFGGSIVLVGGPEETPLAGTVVARLPAQSLDLTGKTNLRQLVAVLAQADVMVSNDSGPLHIAAALGRPVVAPYTCTSPVRTGPYSEPRPLGSGLLGDTPSLPYGRGSELSGVVQTKVWCAASYLKRCDRMDCMKELTPERLWPILKHHLTQCQRLTA